MVNAYRWTCFISYCNKSIIAKVGVGRVRGGVRKVRLVGQPTRSVGRDQSSVDARLSLTCQHLEACTEFGPALPTPVGCVKSSVGLSSTDPILIRTAVVQLERGGPSLGDRSTGPFGPVLSRTNSLCDTERCSGA